MGTLFSSLLRDRNSQFGEDLFHILPDLSSIVIGVIPEEICRVKSRHKFYRTMAYAGYIFLK